MGFTLIQCHQSAKHQEKCERLRDLANNSIWFEDLIVSWVEKDRAVLIGSNRQRQTSDMVISFLEGNDTIAMVSMSIREAKQIIGDYKALNETTHNLADKEGYVVEEEWFINRNERLGILDNFEFDRYQIPASALGELVLSYIMSSAGLVKIDLFAATDILATEQYYDVALVFLGKDLKNGWHEQVLLSCDDLSRFIEKRNEIEREGIFSIFGPYVR